MTAKRINLIVAAVFLIVGIVATLNTLRLNDYIRQTMPRDTAQEECNTDTIAVLTQWLQIRKQRDTAMNQRDEATIAVLDRLVAGQQPSPEELTAWRDGVDDDRHVRATADASSPPLPQC